MTGMSEDRAVEVGKRVAEARKRAGLTQEALGAVVGVDKTAMSKIEHGRRRLDGFELSLVAEATGTTARDLLGLPERRSVLAVAARVAVPVGPAAPVLTRARQILELDGLADELGLPGGAQPRRPVAGPTGTSEKAATALADELRAELGLGDGPLRDLVGLCERECGVDVAFEPLGSDQSGLLVHAGDEVALALVNSDEPAARQRFTLAHELAHHLFNDPAEVIVEGAGAEPVMERRCDAFAAELLMPVAGVRRLVGDGPVTEAVLVDAMVGFGVSRQAMLTQLRKLKVITEDDRGRLVSGTARALFASVGRGADFESWATGVTSRRVPSRVQSRLLEGYRKGRLGIGSMAALLSRDAEELRDELTDAGVTPVFADHDHALADL
jgi:Zn-dependent peptidase ImmA (M78 family)/transcriptional regulator with XRE-family HTH domain